MSKRVVLMVAAVGLLGTSCATMMQMHREQMAKSLTIAEGVELAEYNRVTVLPLTCSGPFCDPGEVDTVASRSAMALGRVGYEVYDYQQLYGLMVTSYQTVVMPSASVSVSGDGAGMSVTATDPETGETVQMTVSGDQAEMGMADGSAHMTVTEESSSTTTTTSSDGVTTTHTVSSSSSGGTSDGMDEMPPASVSVSAPGGHAVIPGDVTISYDTLPMEAKQMVLQRSGVDGVLTGRVVTSHPDDITGFVDVSLFLRLGDAATGKMIWQFEWREWAHDGAADVPGALTRSVDGFEEAYRFHTGQPTQHM